MRFHCLAKVLPGPQQALLWTSGVTRELLHQVSLLILPLIVLITVSLCEVDERRVALKVGGVLKLAKQLSDNSQGSF